MSNILNLFKGGGETLSGDDQDTLQKIETDELRAQEREDQAKTERLQAELDRNLAATEKAEAELAAFGAETRDRIGRGLSSRTEEAC